MELRQKCCQKVVGSSPINDFIFLLNHWMNYAIFLQNDVFDLESGNGRVASVYGFSIFLPTPPVVFSRSGGVCDRHNNDDALVVCGN